MPYIITTKRRGNNAIPRVGRTMDILTRHAVATLDEAREVAKTAIIDGPVRCGVDHYIIETYRLPEQGGTIGPLPDGTVIEVRPVKWIDLYNGPIRTKRQIIDAYNYAQKGSAT